jgi:addiction module HigA family antidote
MIPENRLPTSPGEILLEEFLKLLGITEAKLAHHLSLPVRRVNDIVRGRRAVSPETAQLLARAFRTTPQFWMNAQTAHDLATHRIDVEVDPLVQVA